MNYYQLLGINNTATEAEIKTAYKKAALAAHPDRNTDPGTAEKFIQIQTAYQTLSDNTARRAYDQSLAGSGHRSIFERFRRASKQRFSVTLTLEESIHGTATKIPGYPTTIVIPPGIRDGASIVDGNIVLTVSIMPHHKFARRNDDLVAEAKIDAIQAMCGVTVNVTTPYKKTIAVKIPAGTQHGTVLKAAGKGVVNHSGHHTGDLLIVCLITIPRLTSEQQDHIINLLSSSSINI